MAGYSSTPLFKKLGYQSEFRVLVVNTPEHYFEWIEGYPDTVGFFQKGKGLHLIHYFETTLSSLYKKLPLLKERITQNGMIWVSWPKKSSKVPTDINEDEIRKLALSIGLVDVKVCAVSEVWSALKLVIPVSSRKN